MAARVKLLKQADQLEANDQTWLTLKELRELVRQADELGWDDTALVSHGRGSSEHPRLRDLHCATRLVVVGPS